MSDRYGLIIANDGQVIDRDHNKVDSRLKRWSVDLEANPAHEQIVDVTGGSAFVDPGGSAFVTQQEALDTVPHKFGFTPLVLPYFYILSKDADTSQGGGYAGDAFYFSGSLGTLNDAISYEVDKTSLRIVHRLDTFGFATGYTSQAGHYKIRVKFYIMPIDTGLDIYRYMGDPY